MMTKPNWTPCDYNIFGTNRIDLNNPEFPRFDLSVAGTAMSKILRFNGNVPYGEGSFGAPDLLRHSLFVAWLVENYYSDVISPVKQNMIRHALVHDCHELLTGDLTYPIQAFLLRELGDAFYVSFHGLQKKIDEVIFRNLNLEPLLPIPAATLRKLDVFSSLIEARHF